MRIFNIYYSGVITIEAETKEEAKDEFYRKYLDYSDVDVDEVEDITNEFEDWEK